MNEVSQRTRDSQEMQPARRPPTALTQAPPMPGWTGVPIIALTVALALPAAAAGQDEPDLMEELRRAAEEAGVDLDLPEWEFGGEATAAIGWRDNVELAAFDPRSSGFVLANANALVRRAPYQDQRWSGILDATEIRYFAGELSPARLILGRIDWRWRPHEQLRITVQSHGLYHDEVVDVASLESAPGQDPSLRVRLASYTLAPDVRWTFAPGWTLTAGGAGERANFRAPLDDYWEGRARCGLERRLNSGWSLEAAGLYLWRDYDTRPPAATGGRPLAGSTLRTTQAGAELGLTWRGGGQPTWELSLGPGWRQNRDHASGWYDYERSEVEAGLTAAGQRWRISLEAAWREWRYRLQWAGFGLDPPKRRRTEWSGLVRMEWTLRDGLAALAEAEWQSNRSNDVFLDYDDLIASAGLRWSW